MTKQQLNKMHSYMIPREWIWNNKEMGVRSNMFIRLYALLAKHDYNNRVWEEILEDVIMETFQYAIKNDKFMAPNYFIRRAKTYYFRELYKMNGLSQTGKAYKDPQNHVVMSYVDPTDFTDGTYGSIDIDGNYDKPQGFNTNPDNWYKGYENTNYSEEDKDER